VGGGHAPGTGRRGTTEFPVSWSRDRIMDEILDVAKNPDEVPRRQHNGRWCATGIRGGVEIVVLIEPSGEIHTGYPVRGAGVTRNPDQPRDPANLTVADLEAGRVSHFATSLLDWLADRLPAEDLAHYRSLHYAGEWEELADVLAAHVHNEGIALSDEERDELRRLTA
jgi:hypothetical protein